MDPFGRKIDYLRISVTDRCNERCLYCMPEGYKGWERGDDHLTASEIIRIAGVRRAGIPEIPADRRRTADARRPLDIVRAMSEIPGVAIVGLSTNGMKLSVRPQNICVTPDCSQ